MLEALPARAVSIQIGFAPSLALFLLGSCDDLEGRRELEGGDSGSDTGDPGNVSDICWCQFPVPQFFRESRVVT